jgi:hypothetical protein
MHSLSRRVARLEEATAAPFVLTEAIDRPPQETREQWLARKAGNPTLGLVNSRGQTHAQWVDRRLAELASPAGNCANPGVPLGHPQALRCVSARWKRFSLRRSQ